MSGSALIKLCKKQAATRSALRKWNKQVFGHYQDRINQLLKKISDVQNGPHSEENGRVEDTLQAELAEWLARCEILWKQKSLELWLKEGDRNTKFFHLSTIIKRRHNNIDAINLEDNNWVMSSNQIRQLLFNSFKNTFAEEEVSFPEHLDNLISPCISVEENLKLCNVPSPEEIKSVMPQPTFIYI